MRLGTPAITGIYKGNQFGVSLLPLESAVNRVDLMKENRAPTFSHKPNRDGGTHAETHERVADKMLGHFQRPSLAAHWLGRHKRKSWSCVPLVHKVSVGNPKNVRGKRVL